MKKKIIFMLLLMFGLCLITGCGNSDKETFTVTFDSNGGSEIVSQQVIKGEQIIEPENPINDGFEFLGWYYNETKWDFNNQVNNDMTLIAEWDTKEFGFDELFEYTTINNNQSIVINKYIGKLNEVVIPSNFDGKTILEISNNAFDQNQVITSLIIPIGEYAFNECKNLTSIEISDSVTSIGKYAFYGCTSLKNITIPNNITKIEQWTFANCTSLTNIVIPNSVISIDSSAFSYCDKLESIIIPSSIKYIGDFTFYRCDKLTINCVIDVEPVEWNKNWNIDNRPVNWGYKGN